MKPSNKPNIERVNAAIKTIGENGKGFGRESGECIIHNVIIDFDKREVCIPRGCVCTISASDVRGTGYLGRPV